jgi:hypothetical protein
MVLGIATQRKDKGKHFYGCADNPQYRELLPVPASNRQVREDITIKGKIHSYKKIFDRFLKSLQEWAISITH